MQDNLKCAGFSIDWLLTLKLANDTLAMWFFHWLIIGLKVGQ